MATIVNSALRSMDINNIYTYMADIIASDAAGTLWGAFQQNPIRMGGAFVAMILLLIISVGLWLAYRFARKKNIALNKAYGAKSDFLSQMSHEMRTPLNAIMGFSDLGLKETKEAVVSEYFGNIQMSGKYLLGVINDILDMTKIEQSKIVLYPQTVDFREFIRDIRILLEDAVEKKSIEFSIVCKNPEISYAVFDPLRVQQILMNLLSNAIKYSHQGGKVICTIENISKEKETIRLKMTIKDHGVGMSTAFLDHLFEPFTQEQNEYSYRLNSCGLGLSIAKNLVDQMNGSIKVNSRLGEGSEFTVVLPMQMAATPTSKQVEEADAQGKLTMFAGMRVLLCEDHPLNAKIAQKLLEKQGFTVDIAENGQIGVDKYRSTADGFYNVVLMDIRMPVMDGLEAGIAIRQSGKTDSHSIPIIAVTANAFEDDVLQTQKAGMNACVAKPIDPATLYGVLRQWIFEARNPA